MSMNNSSPATEKSRKDFWTCWVEHEGLVPDGGCGVTVFRLSLTRDRIHWSPSFMKIVGWLWINTRFALLHHYILPLCPVERHYTVPKFPFPPSFSHLFPPGFPFKGNLLLFCPFAFILFFHLDNNGKGKMNLFQTYFSNFTIIWYLWYPSPSPSSYQGCYGPTETFLLPPV